MRIIFTDEELRCTCLSPDSTDVFKTLLPQCLKIIGFKIVSHQWQTVDNPNHLLQVFAISFWHFFLSFSLGAYFLLKVISLK